jgi:protein-tyrosine phosphatase
VIDIHCHLLPAIDDGPESMEEAVTMARIAAADGISDLIVTPHQRHPSWPTPGRRRLEAVLEELRRSVGPTPRLALGAEVRVDSELLGDLERGGEDAVLGLAGSRYLLLELDTFPVGPDPADVVREVRFTGRVPILSHPERIPWLAEDPELLARLVELGALTQVTAASLAGAWGRRPQACCRFLLDNGMAHFAASDAHDPYDRTPVLSAVRATIADGWGDEVAAAVTHDNAAAILADRPL